MVFVVKERKSDQIFNIYHGIDPPPVEGLLQFLVAYFHVAPVPDCVSAGQYNSQLVPKLRRPSYFVKIGTLSDCFKRPFREKWLKLRLIKLLVKLFVTRQSSAWWYSKLPFENKPRKIGVSRLIALKSEKMSLNEGLFTNSKRDAIPNIFMKRDA